jgi:hypothetical protein
MRNFQVPRLFLQLICDMVVVDLELDFSQHRVVTVENYLSRGDSAQQLVTDFGKKYLCFSTGN